MQKNGSKNIWSIVLTVVVVLCVIFFFVLFINGNSKRATEISIESLKDSTYQSAQRINEILERAQREIVLTADLYEEMLEEPVVTIDDLKTLTEESPFDYIEFIDTDGMSFNSSDESKDVSDKDFFKDGMDGNSGIDVIFNLDVAIDNIVVFYTPLYYKGDIIGVLTGFYLESQIEDIIYSTFFDETSRTFICTNDGTVIAGCNYNKTEDVLSSIFQKETFNQSLDDETAEGLKQALLNNEDYEFQYAGTAGTGNAYATPLNTNNWTLIQTFPSQITSRFIHQANTAGVILLVELIAIFIVCVVIILVTNHVVNRKLVLENAEKTYVVDGITHLFKKFILVDFKKGTYRYLAGTKPRTSDFPLTGEYDTLKDFIISCAKDDEDIQHLNNVLDMNTVINNLDESNTHLRYEFRTKQDDDVEKWDSLNIICLKRSNNMPKEVLFTCQDVSVVKAREMRSYEALKQAYQAVESANNAKTSFLSSMSHDIRTPMNGIIGMTAIAAAHINEPERVSDCLQKITTASKHLLGLINEVLDMSKIESGKIDLNEEEFKLSDLIDNLLTMVKPHVESKKHNLDITINNVTHEKVIGDSLRIQQVFMNLMSNAIKYTPNGGNIKLIISEKPTNQCKSGFYEFVIEDNGIGMSDKFLEKIFEPFIRADDDKRVMQVQGTGLGMPIARNIVRMMGGDIQVESSLNVGTKVTVTFFLKLQDESEINYEEFINLPVLVTDDDEMSCKSACNILNELGMKSEWVLSGKEAVQRVIEKHNLSEDFFAVILDWKMDEMDGVATAKAIRKEVGEDIPIIIISAYDWSEIEQEARKAGVNAFISKPLFKSRMVNLFNDLVGISKEKTEENKNALSTLEKLDLSGKRVLLVEDNELNLEIAKEILEVTGVSVECAKNGAEAVDRIASIPDGYYDIVLMDIQMPVMNGYEATRAIRSLDRNYTKMLPIIAMTANAFVEDVHMAKGSGMNGHISKPLDLNILADVLLKWIL